MLVVLISFILNASKAGFKKAIILCFILLFSVTAYSENAFQPSHRSLSVQAVVLGIISYTRWPQVSEKVNICATGQTSYVDDLLSSETMNLNVVRLYPFEYARSAEICDVIYIGHLSLVEKQALLDDIAGKPVLSISEENKLCDDGTLVCLSVNDKRVGFQINIDAVARSGLRIQPKVLMLGR